MRGVDATALPFPSDRLKVGRGSAAVEGKMQVTTSGGCPVAGAAVASVSGEQRYDLSPEVDWPRDVCSGLCHLTVEAQQAQDEDGDRAADPTLRCRVD